MGPLTPDPHGRSEAARQRTFARFDARLQADALRRRRALRIAVALTAAAAGCLIPIRPTRTRLPDPEALERLHALHEVHAAAIAAPLPEGASAEGAPPPP